MGSLVGGEVGGGQRAATREQDTEGGSSVRSWAGFGGLGRELGGNQSGGSTTWVPGGWQGCVQRAEPLREVRPSLLVPPPVRR